MTPNQKAFQAIKEKAERWISKGEKQGISFGDTVQEFIEQPDRITKQMLKKLEKEMNKPRWQFFEKYGTDIETGEPYKRPTKEKPKTPTKDEEYDEEYIDFTPEEPELPTADGEFDDIFEKASFYIDNLMNELSSSPSNQTILDAIREELNNFLTSAEEEDCEKFCQNYEENKPIIQSLFVPIIYESDDYNIVWNATSDLFDYLFDGTYYKPNKEKVEKAIEIIEEYRRSRRRR